MGVGVGVGVRVSEEGGTEGAEVCVGVQVVAARHLVDE